MLVVELVDDVTDLQVLELFVEAHVDVLFEHGGPVLDEARRQRLDEVVEHQLQAGVLLERARRPLRQDLQLQQQWRGAVGRSACEVGSESARAARLFNGLPIPRSSGAPGRAAAERDRGAAVRWVA